MIEKQIISSAITNKSYLYLLLENRDLIQDFRNRIILDALQELNSQNIDIDSIVLSRHLATTGADKKVPIEYITDIITSYPGTNPKYLIDSLREERFKENLKLTAKDLYNSIENKKLNYSELINKINEIKNNLDNKTDQQIYMSDYVKQDIDDIFKPFDMISYNLNSLDISLGGMFKGQLITIAGTPGSGKTVLGFQLAYAHRSLYFSLEMKKRELYARLLSSIAKVPALKIESKKLNDIEFERVLKAKIEIQDKIKMLVYDSESDFYKILNNMRRHVEQDDIQVIVIDYLQLISGVSGHNTNDKIEEMTRAFKNFAHNYNIPVVLLSQFTKDVIKDGKEPNIGHLRGSGSIGQDSDVVLMLYEYKDRWTCTIGKCRKGRTGTVDLQFQKEHSRIVDGDYFSSLSNPEYFQD